MAEKIHNLLLIADAYKYSHYLQYPEGSQYVTSYIEARGFSKLFNASPEVVFIGIRAFIEDYLMQKITMNDVWKAQIIITAMGLPFNYDGFKRIVEVHDGYFPVKIEALPEGTTLKPGIPLVQVTNTDPEIPWVTSFIETALLRAIWYPTTVATLSREVKKVIKHYLEMTADDLSGLPFKLHDFGARGATSHESAALGGMGHLVNFLGTDTVEAVEMIYDLYNRPDAIGYSIPAAEHSTITSWPKELTAFKNMLDKFPTGLVAVVSDSYNIYEACEKLWGEELKEQIVSRDGTLVIRPDSGDPVAVTLEVIEILGKRFGFEINSKGYKVLPKYIRIIQGDGINLESIDAILHNFAINRWSADNIAFGMGGALLQKVDRDTLKFAMKANEIVINGVAHDVFKNPITDKGKTSKKGKQLVIREANGNVFAVAEKTFGNYAFGEKLLTTVYEDGELVGTGQTWEEIKELAAL